VAAPVVELSQLSKTFGGAHALRNVDMEIAPGEVHGLLGENGSGKSTLIKILAGYHDPDPGGELRVNGAPVRLPLPPGRFRGLGMAFVHQDLGLVPDLSVVENLRVRVLVPGGRRRISWARERRRARELFRDFDVDIDPWMKVADLSATEQALLAIVRALDDIREGRRDDHGHGLLVLDETTVFLPEGGRRRLFDLMRNVTEDLASVLFVSHDLDEVRQVTDRVTVLRDGRVQDTVRTDEVSERTLVELILGRGLASEREPKVELRSAEPYVRVTDVNGHVVRGADLEARRGEVLGLTGLVGSGYDEILYLIFGARRARSGVLAVEGRTFELSNMNPNRAVGERIGLIPADRLRDGSVGSLLVADNVMLQVLGNYRPWALKRGQIQADARTALHTFKVRPADPNLTYENLSGGNQQLALLAKWLHAEPQLLLLHEPTQGVDVGAREQIFHLIRQAAAKGSAIMVASNDAEQLANICQRVVVFARGRPVSELHGDEVTKERLSEQSYALAEAATPDDGKLE
jgi:ribose transport system ATP-binding protein